MCNACKYHKPPGGIVYSIMHPKITTEAKTECIVTNWPQWNILDRAQGSALGSGEQSVHSVEEEENEEEAIADQKSPVLIFN